MSTLKLPCGLLNKLDVRPLGSSNLSAGSPTLLLLLALKAKCTSLEGGFGTSAEETPERGGRASDDAPERGEAPVDVTDRCGKASKAPLGGTAENVLPPSVRLANADEELPDRAGSTSKASPGEFTKEVPSSDPRGFCEGVPSADPNNGERKSTDSPEVTCRLLLLPGRSGSTITGEPKSKGKSDLNAVLCKELLSLCNCGGCEVSAYPHIDEPTSELRAACSSDSSGGAGSSGSSKGSQGPSLGLEVTRSFELLTLPVDNGPAPALLKAGNPDSSGGSGSTGSSSSSDGFAVELQEAAV
mmetsp:Transcript_47850/g.95150  ORF Transcript_47850/g.95150 Transcript_47850/m.95150 type:complete len:300 (+) Transcript_47850:2450-3349(+)